LGGEGEQNRFAAEKREKKRKEKKAFSTRRRTAFGRKEVFLRSREKRGHIRGEILAGHTKKGKKKLDCLGAAQEK